MQKKRTVRKRISAIWSTVTVKPLRKRIKRASSHMKRTIGTHSGNTKAARKRRASRPVVW